MKLPSLTQIISSARRTLWRFPLSLSAAFLGTIAALLIADQEANRPPWWSPVNNVLIACTLGIALSAVIVLLGERLRVRRLPLLLWQLGGVLFLVLYGLTLPRDIYGPPLFYGIRHWMLLAGVHLLVAFVPFARAGEENGFWQYNRSLFLGGLTSALYSAVLWGGLSLALAAVSHLFDIEVRGVRYFQLWIIIVGIFNTWFFLAGVPENLENLQKETLYPKGLKLFTQYVLIPLVSVYLLILYAYSIKILLEWSWPKGWVADLVLGFSVTGILALLLVHPIRDLVENVWMKHFARFFYVAEVPLVILLSLAIWRRVSEYGITENRYFVIGLALWLAAVVVYFLLWRAPSIKLIPASLCAMILLGSFGPWGAFAVSERSQVMRLEGVLQKSGILKDGKVVKPEHRIPFEDAQEISSIVRYLSMVHDFSALQPWFKADVAALSGDGAAATLVASWLGVQYIPEWQARQRNIERFSAKSSGAVDISGFETLVRFSALKPGSTPVKLSSPPWANIEIALVGRGLRIVAQQEGGALDTINVDLIVLTKTLLREEQNLSDVPPEALSTEARGREVLVKVFLDHLEARTTGESFDLQWAGGEIALKRVAPPGVR
jgi:hypothetical protein